MWGRFIRRNENISGLKYMLTLLPVTFAAGTVLCLSLPRHDNCAILPKRDVISLRTQTISFTPVESKCGLKIVSTLRETWARENKMIYNILPLLGGGGGFRDPLRDFRVKFIQYLSEDHWSTTFPSLLSDGALF